MQLARSFGAAIILFAHMVLAARHADSEEMRSLLSARDEDEWGKKGGFFKWQMERQKQQLKLQQMKNKIEHAKNGDGRKDKSEKGHHGNGYNQQYGMQQGHPHMQPGVYQAPQPGVYQAPPPVYQAPPQAPQPVTQPDVTPDE
eukprot:TRINITY_DN241_c0_g2_i1.p1 TRINITY_DN241_c0_g2~~TRINITY_DN241_c0_g2_i1.p1  ORF type:complete len:143 (+),score=30.06 TRINITY_DN241_c0_g2_i1:85-513(+)